MENQALDKAGIAASGLPDIKGFQQTTMLDWEGRIASVIFLGGCNFRCNFCHSKDLVVSPEKLDSLCFDDIENFLSSKTGWVDGVVITGGEPTLFGSSLRNLIQLIKDRGFPVKLDTNGTSPGLLSELLDNELLDYIAMDIKAPFNYADYRRASGCDININNIVLSKDIVLHSGVDYEFRTTVVPGVINEKNIIEIAKDITGAKKYCLQQFVPRNTLDPAFMAVKPYRIEIIRQMADSVLSYVANTIVRSN